MPRTKFYIEIGNLVVNFGPDLVLLDMFSEVVEPAFFDDTLRRNSGTSTYLFYKPRLVLLDPVTGEVGICGRLVKDTVLERQQIFEDDQLKEASGTLPSSPSSLFLLVLNSHRLLYIREHVGSPSMDIFRSTLAKFLKVKHKQFIVARSKIADPVTGLKPTRKDLLAQYPYPNVELTPIASRDSIQSFVSKFKRVESVTAYLLDTNSEIDNEKMFGSIRSAQSRIKSKRTTLRYENKEGLDKGETAEQLTVLAKQGNHNINLIGYDSSDEKLTGNNEHFKVQIPLDAPPADAAKAAETLYARFQHLQRNDIITVPGATAETKAKMAAIVQKAGQ